MTTPHKQNRRAQIIEAAGRLFESRGSADFTAEELASEAGISRRTIFNYVASPHEATCEYIGHRLSNVMCTPVDNTRIRTPHDVYAHVLAQVQSPLTFEVVQLIDKATHNGHGHRDPKWQTQIYHRSEKFFDDSLAQSMPNLSAVERRLCAKGILSSIENAFTLWIESTTKTYQEWNDLVSIALSLYFLGFTSFQKGRASWLNSSNA